MAAGVVFIVLNTQKASRLFSEIDKLLFFYFMISPVAQLNLWKNKLLNDTKEKTLDLLRLLMLKITVVAKI